MRYDVHRFVELSLRRLAEGCQALLMPYSSSKRLTSEPQETCLITCRFLPTWCPAGGGEPRGGQAPLPPCLKRSLSFAPASHKHVSADQSSASHEKPSSSTRPRYLRVLQQRIATLARALVSDRPVARLPENARGATRRSASTTHVLRVGLFPSSHPDLIRQRVSGATALLVALALPSVGVLCVVAFEVSRALLPPAAPFPGALGVMGFLTAISSSCASGGNDGEPRDGD